MEGTAEKVKHVLTEIPKFPKGRDRMEKVKERIKGRIKSNVPGSRTVNGKMGLERRAIIIRTRTAGARSLVGIRSVRGSPTLTLITPIPSFTMNGLGGGLTRRRGNMFPIGRGAVIRAPVTTATSRTISIAIAVATTLFTRLFTTRTTARLRFLSTVLGPVTLLSTVEAFIGCFG